MNPCWAVVNLKSLCVREVNFTYQLIEWPAHKYEYCQLVLTGLCLCHCNPFFTNTKYYALLYHYFKNINCLHYNLKSRGIVIGVNESPGQYL